MGKILIMSPHNPFLRSSGAENRIYLIMLELAENNEILLFCPKGKIEKLFNINVHQEFLDQARHKTLNLFLIRRLVDVIKKEKPDIIQLEFPWQAINLWLIGKKYNLVEHNVEFIRFRRGKSILWPVIFLYEKLACTFSNKIICVSEKDKEYLVKHLKINPIKIEIVENPVDSKLFLKNSKAAIKIRKEMGFKETELFILFFGQLNYKPNIEALYNIVNEIIPKLEQRKTAYKIVICGKGDGKGLLNRYKHQNLIYLGFVENIQDYINASDMVIAPFISGSGTRMKILEALACKKRVISTTIGAEGIKEDSLLEIADNWDQFINKVICK